MNKNNRGVLEVLFGVAAVIWLTGRCHETEPVFKVKRDTVTVVKTDTVAKVLPVHDTSYVVRYVKVKVESGQSNLSVQSESEKDSVTLAVEQKVYRDSDYVAWVSGVMPQLDSLNIFRKTEVVTITETITKREKAPRLSVGLQAGYGYGLTSRRVEPYVGLGVSWRIVPP